MNTEMRITSHFDELLAALPEPAPDPILDLSRRYKARKAENSDAVNLGVGVYTNESGVVPKLEAMRMVEAAVLEQHAYGGYLDMAGSAEFQKATQRVAFGNNSPLIDNDRVVTVQGLGGTGSLALGGHLLRAIANMNDIQPKLLLSDPSWANHRKIFGDLLGFDVQTHPYYDKASHTLKFDEMVDSLLKAERGTVLLLHACCHNPSGQDMDDEQLRTIARLARDKDLLVFFDMAYQGFREGLEQDNNALRIFAEENVGFLLAQSFSKSLSLYRSRVGALHVVGGEGAIHDKAFDYLRTQIIRTLHSNPPSFGAGIVTEVVNNEKAFESWVAELGTMRERIAEMRVKFVDALKSEGVSLPTDHLLKQSGMFSFVNLDPDQVKSLENKHDIFVVGSGRICFAAMNEGNIPIVVKALKQVVG